MDRSELLNLAASCALKVKEGDGESFVMIPTWQIDTFVYFPHARQYVYSNDVKVQLSAETGQSYYVIPLKFLDLDKDYLPDNVVRKYTALRLGD